MMTISFRPDEETAAALTELAQDGADRTAIIKESILARLKQRRGERLREESLALANDPDDRAEAQAILAYMENL